MVNFIFIFINSMVFNRKLQPRKTPHKPDRNTIH